MKIIWSLSTLLKVSSSGTFKIYGGAEIRYGSAGKPSCFSSVFAKTASSCTPSISWSNSKFLILDQIILLSITIKTKMSLMPSFLLCHLQANLTFNSNSFEDYFSKYDVTWFAIWGWMYKMSCGTEGSAYAMDPHYVDTQKKIHCRIIRFVTH